MKNKNEEETNTHTKPLIIGLAGASCTGKNTVAEILKKRGWNIIDADEISKKVFTSCTEEILLLFSAPAAEKRIQILKADRTLDKRKFSNLVFSDLNLLKKLEDFILPKIVYEAETEIRRLFKENPDIPIVLNAPTLHKTSLLERCLFVLYIQAPFFKRFIRALRRDKRSLKEIFLRFMSQRNFFSQYIFLKADILKVKNTGSTAQLEKRLNEVLLKRGF